MLSLCYVSASIKRFNNDDLTQLLKVCHKNNSQNHITGLLLYNGHGTFIQLLEGNDKDVTALYNKIQRDPRHTKINCIARQTITMRNFPDWKMGFKYLDDTEIKSISGYSDFMLTDKPLDYLISTPNLATALLMHFKNKSDEIKL